MTGNDNAGMDRKRTPFFILAVFGSVIFLVCLSGCIGSSFAKTETVIAKLDPAGNPQWTTVFENSGYASARSLAPGTVKGIQTPDGYLLAGFFTNTTGQGFLRVLLTDTTGHLIRETLVTGIQDHILIITPRHDGGYLIVSEPGFLFMFSRQGEFENDGKFSDYLYQQSGNDPDVVEVPPVTLLTISYSDTGDLTALVQDHADIYHPFRIVRLFSNGTIRNVPLLDPAGIDWNVSIRPVRDGGNIIIKPVYQNEPGGGKQILLERTNAGGMVLWNATLGTCAYTFCNNDLIDISEEEPQKFTVIYQSHEQSNATSSTPVTTIRVLVDDNGHVVDQDTLRTVTDVPLWIFRTGSTSDFRDMLSQRDYDVLTSAETSGRYRIHSVSVLGTDDGGYVLIATRYLE